jgi:hypothetical protein
MQEVKCGSSLGSGNDLALHFGLGQATVAEVTILWPDGTVEKHNEAPFNQIWLVEYRPPYQQIIRIAGITLFVLILIGLAVVWGVRRGFVGRANARALS